MAESKITPDTEDIKNKVFLKPFKIGKSEKYGLFDIKGNFIIEPKFDSAPEEFSEGCAAVKIDGKFGFINTKGEWVIEPKFDNASNFSEGFAAVKIDYRWGYINHKGEWAIEPKFEWAYAFHEGLACVTTDDFKNGYINTKGEWVIEPKFDSAPEEFSEGLAAVKIDGKYGFINTKGEWVIEPKFYSAEEFKNGEAKVWLPVDDIRTTVGVINTKGEWIIEPKDDISKLSEGLIRVWVDRKYGFVNSKGEWVIEPKYDYVKDFSEGLAAVNIDGKSGYINTKGEFAIDPKYSGAKSFSEGLAAVYTETSKGRKCGFINTKGEWVIEPKYDHAFEFSEGLAYVGNRIKTGDLNSKGELMAAVRFGFINTKGEKVTILTFSHAHFLGRYFKNGLVVVDYGFKCTNHKSGVLNTKGEWLVEPVYDNCQILEDGLIQIEIGKKTGYMNTRGEWVIKPYTVKKAKQQNNQSETSPRIRMRKIKIELYGRGCQINTYHLKGFPGENYRAMRDGEYSEIIVHDGKKETAYSTADLGENLVLEERPRDKKLNCYLSEPKGKFSKIAQIELKGHAFINIKIPKDETFDPKKLHFIYGKFVLPDCELEVNTGAVYDGTQYKIEIDPDSAYGNGKTIWKADKK